MNTIQITFNNDIERSIFETLFEKFKIKMTIVPQEQSSKVYGETTAKKIKKAREEKEKGVLTTITPDNLWTQAQ
ncbi:hypothetical protein [Capnocytophaga granulosa]|uniref:hypothetical protein n=1 Tax=Capnocytophaga granulosa TaxID=45242 RepID=UPI003C719D8F